MITSATQSAYKSLAAIARRLSLAALAASFFAGSSGCFTTNRCCVPDIEPCYVESACQVNPPDTCIPSADGPQCTPEPRSLRTVEPQEQEYWDVDLSEAIHYGLTNSRALTDVGGLVLRTPDTVQTNLSPIITQMDPRFGIEAALSAFDAQLNVTGDFQKNDRAINNLFASGGVAARTFDQDLGVYRMELLKRSVTGAQYAVRNVTEYDANNAPANLFGSAWTTYYEAEIRQPLLQGAGTRYNRIAGPTALPGLYNGVVIARVNADIAQADFEIGVREYLSNVENAYWDLYYAYRDLDAKIAARDVALKTWKRIQERAGKGLTEGFREAQARDQYYRFEQDVKNALTGRRLEGTHTNNGSPGGTFRATPGVYLAERRLRLLMGIPATDQRLIRPRSEPTLLQVVHVWDAVRDEAIQRRPELCRQRFRLQRAELEFVAAQNFLKPRFDAIGRYRFRGFGDTLAADGIKDAQGRFGSAYSDLGTGNFQEWQLGFEMNAKLGARQGRAAVTQAEYRIAKERTLLYEQERMVVHDLSNAIAELDRAYELAKLAYDRRHAAQENLAALVALEQQDRPVFLDTLLDAQRRLLDADLQYHQAVIDYQVALKNVNLEKGSLLDYHNILTSDQMAATTPEADQHLADGPDIKRKKTIDTPNATEPPPPAEPQFQEPGGVVEGGGTEADESPSARTEQAPSDSEVTPAVSTTEEAPVLEELDSPPQKSPAVRMVNVSDVAEPKDPPFRYVQVADVETPANQPAAKPAKKLP